VAVHRRLHPGTEDPFHIYGRERRRLDQRERADRGDMVAAPRLPILLRDREEPGLAERLDDDAADVAVRLRIDAGVVGLQMPEGRRRIGELAKLMTRQDVAAEFTPIALGNRLAPGNLLGMRATRRTEGQHGECYRPTYHFPLRH